MSPFPCPSCTRSFSTPSTVQQHITLVHSPRPYCETCIEWFPTDSHLQYHITTSPEHNPISPRSTYDCSQCSLNFSTQSELDDHKKYSLFHRYTAGRFYCDDCVLWFSDEEALEKHLRDGGEHASHFACVECGREFLGRRELEAHVLMGELCRRYGVSDLEEAASEPLRNPHPHARRTRSGMETPRPGYESKPPPAASGSSTFEGEADAYGSNVDHELEADNQDYLNYSPWELNSRAMNTFSPQQNNGILPNNSNGSTGYSCLGETCFRTFATPSALLQHLDSGACPSGINRHLVNSATISADHGSVITNRLLRAAAGRNIHEVNADEEDTEDRKVATNFLTHRPMQNGLIPFGRPQPPPANSSDLTQNLRCPLCPRFSSPFKSPQALHAHMTSPVHDAKIYHCPTTREGEHSSRNFSTLGALAQHLENQGCVLNAPTGAGTFRGTLSEVQQKLRQVALGNSNDIGRLQD